MPKQRMLLEKKGEIWYFSMIFRKTSKLANPLVFKGK